MHGNSNIKHVPPVVNRHNTARVAPCWLIIYYRLVMHGNSNIKHVPPVVNEHNTARVASCWFIIYYRLVMHGNSNIKLAEFFLEMRNSFP